MPGVKEIQQGRIDRLTSLVEGTSQQLFNGALEKGFLYWSTRLCLSQAESMPTEDDLLVNITDGKDDLEIDAYHIDEDGNTIFLFQSKFRSKPENIPSNHLANFLQAPSRLTNPQALVNVSNEKILQLAPLFREKVLDGFALQLVFLSTGRATQPVRAAAEKWNKDSLVLYVAGEAIEVAHNVLICDVAEILNQFDSSIDDSELVIDLHLQKEQWHLSPTGAYDCVIATLEAEELAQIFNAYKYKIFRRNPRGPLSAAKVNKEIAATLDDDVMRPLFHLLNNGLSAVCHSFSPPRISNGNDVTTVRDFQIVNGCQTTYSLWDYWRRGGSLKASKVLLKVVAAPTLERFISKTSNSQNQMKDWDFLFDDSVQQQIQREFEQLPTLVFYELRRGEHAHMVQSKAERVTIKDIAQATWAFMGFPGQAKDKLRDIPRSVDTRSGTYREVFFEGVTAAYLWLPWLSYKRVQKEYQAHFDETQVRGDFREHGRLHVLWLIGRGVTIGLGKKTYRDVDTKLASRLASSIDLWFPELHRMAAEAVEYVVDVKEEVAAAGGQPLQLRQLFRSSSDNAIFEKAFDARFGNSAVKETVRGLV